MKTPKQKKAESILELVDDIMNEFGLYNQTQFVKMAHIDSQALQRLRDDPAGMKECLLNKYHRKFSDIKKGKRIRPRLDSHEFKYKKDNSEKIILKYMLEKLLQLAIDIEEKMNTM